MFLEFAAYKNLNFRNKTGQNNLNNMNISHKNKDIFVGKFALKNNLMYCI
jgi:hypothetical protein